MKKLLIVLVILFILAGGVYAFRQWRRGQQASALDNLQTEVAGRGQLVSTIGATGQVRSSQSTVLPWKTTGTVDVPTVTVSFWALVVVLRRIVSVAPAVTVPLPTASVAVAEATRL